MWIKHILITLRKEDIKKHSLETYHLSSSVGKERVYWVFFSMIYGEGEGNHTFLGHYVARFYPVWEIYV